MARTMARSDPTKGFLLVDPVSGRVDWLYAPCSVDPRGLVLVSSQHETQRDVFRIMVWYSTRPIWVVVYDAVGPENIEGFISHCIRNVIDGYTI